ncbi:MAG: hypothetical protein PHS62_04065 [Patescibacteria group bacterium]|nr:hypothetical protein [Patescibacteria group bacterium]
MPKKDKNKPIVKADLDSLYDRLDKSFDVKFDKKFGEVNQSFDKKFDEINKSFDVKLGKFAEEVILPAVSRIVSDEVGKHRHEMKNYIDVKLSENKGDIISYMKGDQERDKSWKTKVINIFKREKIANQQELEILINLIK